MPLLLVLLAMVSIQSGAAFAKVLFGRVGPEGATALRIGFAALMLLALWRPRLPERRALPGILLYGLALGAMNLSFYLAIARIPLGVAVALEFSGPLGVALLASRRPLDFLWVLAAGVGIYLLLPWGGSAGGAALDPLGVLFALGAAFGWALYIYFGRTAGPGLPGGVVTSLGMAVAALATLPFGIAERGAALFAPELWPPALLLAFLSSALPYSLEMGALKRMPARQFGLLMSLEPVLAALSGFFFLGEKLNFTQLLAIALIIAAVAGSARGVPKQEPPLP